MTTKKKTTGHEMSPATTKQEIDVSRGEPTFEGRYFSFAADIVENDEAVTVLADMPGVSAHTLDADLRDNVLTIMEQNNPGPLKKIRKLACGNFTLPLAPFFMGWAAVSQSLKVPARKTSFASGTSSLKSTCFLLLFLAMMISP